MGDLASQPFVVGTAFEIWAPIEPKQRDLQLTRGDTWRFAETEVLFTDGRSLGESGLVLRCTIKRYPEDDDPVRADLLLDAADGIVQVDSDLRGGITIGDDDESYVVEVADELTDLLPLGRLFYDVVVSFSEGESYTIRWGEIANRADVSRSGTA
jgi:hypothetical protein